MGYTIDEIKALNEKATQRNQWRNSSLGEISVLTRQIEDGIAVVNEKFGLAVTRDNLRECLATEEARIQECAVKLSDALDNPKYEAKVQPQIDFTEINEKLKDVMTETVEANLNSFMGSAGVPTEPMGINIGAAPVNVAPTFISQEKLAETVENVIVPAQTSGGVGFTVDGAIPEGVPTIPATPAPVIPTIPVVGFVPTPVVTVPVGEVQQVQGVPFVGDNVPL